MIFFKKFISFFFFGNIFISLAAACLVYNTSTELPAIKYNPHYALFVFFSTLFIYNLQRFFYSSDPKAVNVSARRIWLIQHSGLLKLLLVVSLAGIISCFFIISNFRLFYLAPFLLLSLSYFISFSSLRKKAWIKVIVLSAVWTASTALMPILLSNKSILLQTEELLSLSSRFFFFMSICIAFDIRDMEVDHTENTKTLALLYGEKTTIYLAGVFMLLHGITICCQYCGLTLSFNVLLALLCSFVLNLFIVLNTHAGRNEYYYIAVIDGTILIQWLSLVIARHYF